MYEIGTIKENILGYVFYTMETPKGYSEGSVKKSVAEKYQKDIKLAFDTFKKMYKDKGFDGVELTKKSINSTINDLMRKKGISATPDEIAKVIGLAVY
jgi:chromosomal replication initiation ATPase DnaA